MSCCRSRRQFVVIAFWKMVMSLVVGIWSLTASVQAIDARDDYPTWEVQ
jgi:hypothetical protein